MHRAVPLALLLCQAPSCCLPPPLLARALLHACAHLLPGPSWLWPNFPLMACAELSQFPCAVL